MKSFGIIGDIHGCIDELRELFWKLRAEGIDEVYFAGDLVDKGPDSHAVIEFCRQHGITGVQGNHDRGIAGNYRAMERNGKILTKNPDKIRTIQSLTKQDVSYLEGLPHYMRLPGNVLLVHAGVLPYIPVEQQAPDIVCRMQLIHALAPGKSLWFGETKDGISEAVLQGLGWRRWYQLWSGPEIVVFGHTTMREPLIYRECFGQVIGIDTGCVYGGKLTAVVFEESGYRFDEVQAKKTYYQHRKGDNWI